MAKTRSAVVASAFPDGSAASRAARPARRSRRGAAPPRCRGERLEPCRSSACVFAAIVPPGVPVARYCGKRSPSRNVRLCRHERSATPWPLPRLQCAPSPPGVVAVRSARASGRRPCPRHATIPICNLRMGRHHQAALREAAQGSTHACHAHARAGLPDPAHHVASARAALARPSRQQGEDASGAVRHSFRVLSSSKRQRGLARVQRGWAASGRPGGGAGQHPAQAGGLGSGVA